MLANNHSIFAMEGAAMEALRHHSARMRWPTSRQIAAASAAQTKTLRQVKGQIAVIPVYGMIEQRPSAWSWMFGGASTDLIGQTLQALLDARDVETIILDVASPGGTIYGVQELSDLIFSLRGKKPILAIANSEADSAAYWIATAADQLIVTPGGEVGSVGAYIMHVDYSAALEADGIKVTFVKAGKYKTDGNSYEPLEGEARDDLQAWVDEGYTAFVKAVARNRGTTVKDVRDNYGQGRCVRAAAALAAGMVDRVATLEQVLGKLSGPKGGSPGAAAQASAEVLRLRQIRRKLFHSFRAK